MSLEFFNKWTPVFMSQLMADFDLSVLDAAAVFGNAGHESDGYRALQERHPLVPGSRGGYGIMQWTGPRRRQFEAYCSRNQYDPANMQVNYKWLWNELQGWEGDHVLPQLKKAKTLKAKTKVFSDRFLRPGIPHMNSRYIWAERALEAWNDRAAVPVPEPPKPPQAADSGGLWAAIIALITRIFKRKD